MALERDVFNLFVSKGWTLSLAESCTGGGIASRLVQIPDASHYFLGGIVAYSNESKIKLLEVQKKTIDVEGAVSEKAAQEMAKGAKDSFQSTCALSVTGIAGPSGGTPKKPIGTVCFALLHKENLKSWTVHFEGNRHSIIEQSIECALSRLSSLL